MYVVFLGLAPSSQLIDFPEVLIATTLGAAALRENGIGTVDSPSHPGLFEARSDDSARFFPTVVIGHLAALPD